MSLTSFLIIHFLPLLMNLLTMPLVSEGSSGDETVWKPCTVAAVGKKRCGCWIGEGADVTIARAGESLLLLPFSCSCVSFCWSRPKHVWN